MDDKIKTIKELGVIPNMPGTGRPALNCDNLGYPVSVGDDEWENKLKKLYRKVPGGWVRK